MGGTCWQTVNSEWDVFMYRMDPDTQLVASSRGYVNMSSSFSSDNAKDIEYLVSFNYFHISIST